MPRQLEPSDGAGCMIGACVRDVQRRLAESGIEDAGVEARRLVCEVAGIRPEALIMRPETLLDRYVLEAVDSAVAKRINGMTIGRIVGERSFYGRSFMLNEATLEPRADSETLVAAVLEIVGEESLFDVPLRIIDVGTGTGCLLISLLAELPCATGVGSDLSERALDAAKANAVRHGVDSRAAFVTADGLAGLAGPFDILISNPPYIQRSDISGLDATVRCHDPLLALDGGIDGLDVYGKIGGQLGGVVPDGWVFLEIGAGMRADVCGVFDAALGSTDGWRVWQDINGIDRCVARKTRSSEVY